MDDNELQAIKEVLAKVGNGMAFTEAQAIIRTILYGEKP